MRALKLFVFSLLSIGLMDNAYALSISYSPSPFQIQQGVSYTNLPFLTTYGASGPVTFSSSSMPSGLILNPDGTISGSTCVSNGNFSGLTARATDSVTSAAATIKFNVTTQPAGGRCASAITVVGTMPAATAGTAYNTSISASGGTGPYTYQLSSGSLPTGLSLSPSGAISGAPTSAGTYSFSVKVTDSTGAVSYQTFTIVVNSNAVSIVTTPSQTSQQGVNYSQSNTVSGGSGTYSYSTSSGALPTGTTLNSGTGVVSGIPTSTGPYSYTVTATETGGSGTSVTTGTIAGVVIASGPLSIAPSAPTGTSSGATYVQQNQAAGGAGTYSYTSSGTLPPGTSLNPGTGQVLGTVVTPGSYTYTVTVTDTGTPTPSTASATTTVTIGSGAVTIGPSSSFNAVSGKSFTQEFTANGGSGPYAFSSNGALPAGLALSTSGTLSGRPTTEGSYSFTMIAIDGQGVAGALVVTINVGARPDPTKDANVIGIQNAQLMASYRFATAQSSNTMARLEGNRDCLRDSWNVQLNPNQPSAASDTSNGHAPSVTNAQGMQAKQPLITADHAAKATPDTDTEQDKYRNRCADRGVWAAGSVDYGNLGIANNSFTTPGITLGVDAKVMKGWIAGLAIGAGMDKTTIGSGAASSKGQFGSLMAYTSAHLVDQIYFDALIGYGLSYFNASRSVSGETFTLNGGRNANQLFSTLKLSGEYKIKGLKLMPYGRLDLGNVNLGSYSESGDTMLALNYESANFNYNTVAGGLKTAWLFETTNGDYQPYLRYEEQFAKSNTVTQTMSYADISNVKYALQSNPLFASASVFGSGMSFTAKSGLGAQLDYTFLNGSNGYTQNSFRLMLRKPF